MARRRFGQHFLFDPHILGRIADALDAPAGAKTLEIGPGPGGLTAVLLERGLRLTAVEKDRDLAARLRARWPELVLVEGDALELDWPAALELEPGEPWYLIGNIPYNITSPLIDKALAPPRPVRVVYLVQQEVALRLAAAPGSEAYGSLTVGVAAAARVERLFGVPAGAFRPRPQVASAVVRLTPLAEPLVRDAERAAFRRFTTGLFGARRKQLVRALRTVTGLDAEVVRQVCAGVNVDSELRPEAIAPAGLVALFRGVVDAGWSRA